MDKDVTSNIELLSNRISRGETTALAVVELAITAAENLNETLNAFLQIDRVGALKRAERLDENKRSNNKDSNPTSLLGVPIGIKDNICVRGLQTSCGSRILGDYHPPYNATVIERLLEAGAVSSGKQTAMSLPWARRMRIQLLDRSRIPGTLARVPGGSSGGSAAAVASGIVPVRSGFRHGRIGAPASFAVWRLRVETNLRTKLSLWSRGFCLVA